MKPKIIGILVLTLVSTSTIVPVSAQLEQSTITIQSSEADVPMWEIGDSWTYHLEYYESTPDGSLTYSVVGDVTFNVVDDSRDSYKLATDFDPQFVTVNFRGVSFKPTKSANFAFTLELSKDDLGLTYWTQTMEGIFLPYIGSIPLPIPIQFLARLENTFNPPWNILPFPLFDGKSGKLERVEFLHDFEVSMFWGMVPLFIGQGEWSLGELGYTCTQEQITVPAGTYTAYNVCAEDPGVKHFISYYNEEVGNVVQESIHIPHSSGETYYDLQLSLLSTTYTG